MLDEREAELTALRQELGSNESRISQLEKGDLYTERKVGGEGGEEGDGEGSARDRGGGREGEGEGEGRRWTRARLS